jgi:hypothetical protein
MQTSISLITKKRIFLSLAALLFLHTRAVAEPKSAEIFPNINSALEAIRGTFHVSTGFENAIGDLDKTPVALDLSGNRVALVFDALIAQRPAYAWILKNGFYDVYPKMRAGSFSQLTVADYVAKDATLMEAVDAIDKVPKVQRWLKRRHMSRGNLIAESVLMPPGGHGPPRRRQSFELKNVPVRTILNQVYGSFGETHWSIWREGQSITMFFS